MILKRFSLLLCFLTIFNCSSNDNKVNKSLANNQETADLMYIEAMSKFNEKQFDEAIIIFKEIERLYPLSNEAIQSQIMSGFIDYSNLNYDDAIYKFSIIINKYPSLKNIDYVYYMKALCYYEQISHETISWSIKSRESRCVCIGFGFQFLGTGKTVLKYGEPGLLVMKTIMSRHDWIPRCHDLLSSIAISLKLLLCIYVYWHGPVLQENKQCRRCGRRRTVLLALTPPLPAASSSSSLCLIRPVEQD